MTRLAALALAACAACGGAVAQPIDSPEALADEYRAWLDEGRVPAACVAFARSRGPSWRPIDATAPGDPAGVGPGDLLVFIRDQRSAVFVKLGRAPLASAGARLIVAHIDAPAPMLRAEAVTATPDGAVLVANAYGGVRRHHWPGIPLALVGEVVRSDGTAVSIGLGLAPGEPVFYVTEWGGGVLRAVAASTPPVGTDGPATATFAHALRERYGLRAADLEASELYLVPAWRAREVGLDRALIGAHGQDDRANSYAAWRALADVNETPERTAIVWLVDREEIGSTGTTGARARFLELVYAWLLRAQGSPADERSLGRALAATEAVSSDTPAALNPNFPEVHVARIAPRLGGGPAMFPYAGSHGKQGSHTARAELIAEVTAVFASVGAPLQVGELGKVEAGGGGTVSKYLAERGIDVVDLGIPVVGMHSPFELVAKRDVWAAYLGFRAWLCQSACAP